MVSRKALIKNEFGIHCRPSAAITAELKQYRGNIRIRGTGGRVADGKSILSVLELGLACGQEVSIEVAGPEEQKMLDRAVALFETKFDFIR